MSMISAQIDELRELVGDGSMEWVAGPVRASVLSEAADTIWQLRDDLQRTHGLLDDAEHDESRAWDRVRKAEVEADKLRDLVRDIGHLLFTLDVDYCATCPKDSINHPCPVYTVDGGECLYKTDMRELGVEVDA